MEYFAYVLKSEKDGRLYKDQTSDIEIPLKQHNLGEINLQKVLDHGI